ncbi:probable lysine-specific demethylase ELF6 [Pistacia vera]|uniref:probable lysine-specific demethylase ELF6 n=1 Tax=Pistacia vera TaxID=55513 RepID=UPI001262BCE2|nr:probable lysine-specific demethylase ELF6 [Pistacia vera]XP_031257333.1 probable lysine-specific demethylase ELF6 [Pistacia vera]
MGNNNNNVEIPTWLKGLPLAPVFRPTDTEFADPIAYISRIEKEASAFGICKIIPPLPKPSKKYVFGNLNKSLLKCPDLGSDGNFPNAGDVPKVGSSDSGNDGEVRAVFTTRHQELGQSVKRTKGVVNDNPQLGVHKQVWQSGAVYTLEQFESKSKGFARSLLGMIKEVSPSVIEALFWKLASEKPIYVEYANDVPGSAFGEPEGQFRYFHRRRRKMKSWKSYRNRGKADCKNNEIGSVNNTHNDDIRDAYVNNDASKCLDTSNLSTTSSTISLDENSQSSRRKIVNGSNDLEGTAGWKLANSPWNLQVIARSPGSLTRFMPDDIPGVTSPMVYIGMLFSWFAWHVEDHELHSMNFLHTGAPKTWYSVPGDYAFTFEEVIRNEVYGGNIDCLAALSLLGEKTTLLSPEVIVASGIPCCRLVQNPGEFVVTFPRAYHVGFSHGFNCGEAANFGTPQWLNVAKEAAVRRAAMNYLPMLSHQQLLYLLTMSFVSRVPRSLLPGARSSRLRDRLKEERELLIKKAFIEDMLKENNTLSALLGQESTSYAVLWNPDLLPCSSRESQLPTATDAVTATPGATVSDIHSEKKTNQNNLLDEMNLYMETLNDLYMDDDDISSDFQIDSGALACVACGILGFPFMSVVQPSERASMEFLPADFVQEGPRISEPKNSHPCMDLDLTKSSVSEDLFAGPDSSMLQKDLALSSITKFNKRWNTSSKYLRPRIFCLEHAVQIEEIFRSKGGANILVVCHSDYQKIKAHAVAIAEEIGSPFNYNDVPLDTASQEDLQLIDLAVDDEEHDECSEDWTSKLGVNLRHCVKVRKNSPSKQVQHALSLGGLFSEKSASSDFSNIKWQSRKSRSKVKLNQPAKSKTCHNIEIKTDEVLGEKLDGVVEKEEKIIQYSRRKFRLKPEASRVCGHPKKFLPEEVSAAICGDLVKHDKFNSEINPCNIGHTGSISAGLELSHIGNSEGLHEIRVLDATRDVSLNYSPSRVADSLAAATLVVDNIGQIGTETLDDEMCYTAIQNNHQTRQIIKDTDMVSEKGISFAEKCSGGHINAADDTTMENIKITNKTCNLASETPYNLLADKDVSVNEVSYPANSPSLHVAHPPLGSFDTEMEDKVLDNFYMNSNAHDCMTSKDELVQDMKPADGNNDEESISWDDKLINQPTPASTKENCEDQMQICAAEDTWNQVSLDDNVHNEIKIMNGTHEEHLSSSVILMDQSTNISLESSEAPTKECAAADLCQIKTTMKEAPEQDVLTTSGSGEELVTSTITQMQPSSLSVEGCSGKPGATCADVTFGSEMHPEIQSTTETNVDELVCSSSLQRKENYLIPASVEECSELPNGICSEENSSGNVGKDQLLKRAQTANATNEEKASSLTRINQPAPAVIQKYCRTRRESPSSEKLHISKEVSSSSKDERELENKSTAEEHSSSASKGKKRKSEVEQLTENKSNCSGYIRSPCEGLRPRGGKDTANRSEVEISPVAKEKLTTKTMKKPLNVSVPRQEKKKFIKKHYRCDLDGCRMSFETKTELSLHKRNRCPHDGCGKRFSSHKYAIIHQRVHDDDRPLKCPWNGCSMSFKWAWARTEHIRVHTGERPYKCKVEGCGLSFRFVSDISRHRRKTGHYDN